MVDRFRPYYVDPVTLTGHSATMRQNVEGDWVRYEDYAREVSKRLQRIEDLKVEVETARNASADIARESERLRDDLTACRLERDAAYRCLRGVASCSTCAVCRGAAMSALLQPEKL